VTRRLRDDELKIGRRKAPVIGQRFCWLVVVAPGPVRGGKRTWVCQCDCGARVTPTTGNLNWGVSRSCGCKKATYFRTHGLSKSGAYKSWVNMHHRCKSQPRYQHVVICKRWLSFENFFADMGDRPPGRTLDRIDNNKGYIPSNCRWATRAMQAQNRRLCKKYEYKGEKRYLGEWAEIAGLGISMLRYRLKRGLTLQQAIEIGSRRVRFLDRVLTGSARNTGVDCS
jgi:hypothetical protein